jgi:signal transduction histidine kinase
MSRGTSLLWRVWIAVASVSVVSVVSVAIVVRTAFRNAFSFYLSHQGMMGGPRGSAPMMIGATEREFQASVDQGIFWSAVAAILVSFVVAYLVARAVARPLARLTDAAQALAEGDLDHRVEIHGPAEVEELGDAFNDMAASLSEAEELRRRMVADVAHELRNPVAALRAQAEGMAEGVLAVDEPRLVSLLEDTEHLSRLVTDLQELSVAEAGGLHYDFVDVDLAALVRREADRTALSAHEGLSVNKTFEPDTTVVVRADEGRIVQVLRNLLSNALRHTGEGTIDVSCLREGDRVRVVVADTGEGIPADDLPYVFERFYRADAARAQDTGGTGVGLAVSRRIVRDHGGDVFAESEPGSGSRVGFWLPIS